MAFYIERSVLIIVTFGVLMHISSAINAKGCTPLDSWTFDKIVPKFHAAIVKFDIAYPYGKKHEEYTKLSAAGRGSPELLVAEVGVKDYGDMENMDLAERFGVTKEDFPKVKFFVNGKDKPFDFDGEFNAEELKKFIRRHSEVYIGLEGCLETFDRIVDRFMTTENQSDKKGLLRKAEDEWDKLKSPSDQQIAETYVKIMRKVLEKGGEFISLEKTRVEGLMIGRITKEKKEEMQGRLNVLKSFTHDEL
ncbi:endoplasmic reticulum resident protein 29-like [Homarus americanus]|uniref:endoplasmic reticulum resident protein 29-like n=1 Tax=Homarus americanus TaxID=6706 RepID=UPI001C44A4C5|nr:endoplasmic reticulum resident protein 29-like [Homarus americanus]